MWPRRYFPGGNRQVSPGVGSPSKYCLPGNYVCHVCPFARFISRRPSSFTFHYPRRVSIEGWLMSAERVRTQMPPQCSRLRSTTLHLRRLANESFPARDRPIPKFFNRAAIGIPFIGTTRRCNGRRGDVSRAGRFPRPFER